MNAEEFAKRLNGRECGQEMTKDEEREARGLGLVIVVGSSDDRMEFYGAIRDEVSCDGGGRAALTASGLLDNKCDCEDCPYHLNEFDSAKKINAIWDSEGYSWIYNTDIPHATFDILEDGEKYCRGIVFNLGDAK